VSLLHQKRALLTALHVAEEVCAPVAHRQVVLTIPKRLRLHTPLRSQSCWAGSAPAPGVASKPKCNACSAATTYCRAMIAAIQTHGELLHWHPHIHALVTCGGFTPEGDFLAVPEFDIERLHAIWQEAVFALYLAHGKIEPEVVANMRTWPHSGFSVDQVGAAAGRRPGGHRAPDAVHDALPAEPVPAGQGDQDRSGDLQGREGRLPRVSRPTGRWSEGSGRSGNFQILAPLDFLAEFTQHIPPQGAHLIRYYGWYSNKSRGMRRQGSRRSCRGTAGGHVPGGAKGVACAPTDSTPPVSL